MKGLIKWVSPTLVSLAWLFTLYVWIGTAITSLRATPSSSTPLVILGLFLALAVILYLAEGLEIAFADLRDKDVNQFGDESTRTLLQEIQGRSEFFFSQRQVFVVSIISFISILIATLVEKLYVYGYGEITDPAAVGALNFVFINVLILCVCQVAPKRLAIINSERFLSQSKWLWPFIKLVGWFNIPGPSDFVVLGLTKLFRYTTRRLSPSRASHYNSSALIHGYCIDQCATHIRLRKDGGAQITRHTLGVYLHGQRTGLTGKSTVGAPPAPYIKEGGVEVVCAWKLELGEDLKEHALCLDELFQLAINDKLTDQALNDKKLSPISIKSRTRLKIEGAQWALGFLDKIPEDVISDDLHMLCVLFRVSGVTEPGAFYLNKPDMWSRAVPSACRKLYFTIEAADTSIGISKPSCSVWLEDKRTPLVEEANRATDELRQLGYVSYPVQSAMYGFEWNSQVEL